MVLADAVKDEALDLVGQGDRDRVVASSPGLEFRVGILPFLGPGFGV